MVVTVLSLGKMSCLTTQLPELPKKNKNKKRERDLEIEESLPLVFRSLWHLTPASWDTVLWTWNTPPNYFIQKSFSETLYKCCKAPFLLLQDSA